MNKRLSRDEWIAYLKSLAQRIKKRKRNNQPTAINVAKLTRGKYTAQQIRMVIVHKQIDHREVGMVRQGTGVFRRRDDWIEYLTTLARKVKRRKTNCQPTAKNVAELTRGVYASTDILGILAKHHIGFDEAEMVRERQEYRGRDEWIVYLSVLAKRVRRRATNNRPTPGNVAVLTRGKHSDGNIRRVLSYHLIDHKEVGMVKGRGSN